MKNLVITVENNQLHSISNYFEGILDTVKESFEGVGILEWKDKLVGIGADGASVNLRKKGGVAALLRQDIQYLIDFHCLPHRLELAVKWRSFTRCCR